MKLTPYTTDNSTVRQAVYLNCSQNDCFLNPRKLK